MKLSKKLFPYLLSFLSLIPNAQLLAQSIIRLNPKQLGFQVVLPANPTTGYQCTLQSYDSTLLRLSSTEYLSSQAKMAVQRANMIGAGGMMIFNFQLIPQGSYPEKTELNFVYVRPWETQSDGQKTEVVTIYFPSTELRK